MPSSMNSFPMMEESFVVLTNSFLISSYSVQNVLRLDRNTSFVIFENQLCLWYYMEKLFTDLFYSAINQWIFYSLCRQDEEDYSNDFQNNFFALHNGNRNDLRICISEFCPPSFYESLFNKYPSSSFTVLFIAGSLFSILMSFMSFRGLSSLFRFFFFCRYLTDPCFIIWYLFSQVFHLVFFSLLTVCAEFDYIETDVIFIATFCFSIFNLEHFK